MSVPSTNLRSGHAVNTWYGSDDESAIRSRARLGAPLLVVGGAVLAGLIRPEGGYAPVAMIGHAFLWDPLFFIWGTALVLSLWLSREISTGARPSVASSHGAGA